MPTRRSRALPESARRSARAPPRVLGVGERVLVAGLDECGAPTFFAGAIMEAHTDGSFEVHFSDGDIANLHASRLRMDPRDGETVVSAHRGICAAHVHLTTPHLASRSSLAVSDPAEVASAATTRDANLQNETVSTSMAPMRRSSRDGAGHAAPRLGHGDNWGIVPASQWLASDAARPISARRMVRKPLATLYPPPSHTEETSPATKKLAPISTPDAAVALVELSLYR